MKCSTCGSEVSQDALFCEYCGTRVTAPSSSGAPTIAIAQPDDTPHAPPAYAAPPVYSTAPPTSNSATVSLIFGILAWVLLPVIGAIVAVIAGHMARREIAESGGRLGGDGLAIAGLVLGYLQLIPGLLICAGLSLLFMMGAMAGF